MNLFRKYFAVPFLALLISTHATAGEGYKSIDAEGLAKMMESEKELTIIDSRGGKWFDGEVITGAKALPADVTTEVTLAALIKDKDAPVVFYCSNTSCPASAAAAHKAAELGYANVYKYPGGIEEWKKKGLPTVKLN